MASVNFSSIEKSFGTTKVIHGISFDIADGEFMVLVGPSGCGKSTLLRMLAGLEEISSGTIAIDGKVVNDVDSKDRDIAMVFQSYALYPHMTVRDNMGFSLKLRKADPKLTTERVARAAKILNLEPYLDRYPRELSGGQRQRVAMGRAIVREPAVFLMDEPLSNLDAKLRVETRSNIAQLQARLGTTTVYVTHDQIEAMTMGHRVALLKDGVLQQVDSPRNLYDRPSNAFVAGFIGSPAMNLRPARLVPSGAQLGNIVLPLSSAVTDAAHAAGLQAVTLGVRPESFTVADAGTEDSLAVEVQLVEELGADAYVYGGLQADEDGAKPFVVRFDGRVPPRIGETVKVAVRTAEEHAFNPESGERLG